jgi:hypothetical protein
MTDSQQSTLVLGGGAEAFVDAADIAAVAVEGRAPITFQDFARRNAHAWTLQAAK